jgi:hypothetical protein
MNTMQTVRTGIICALVLAVAPAGAQQPDATFERSFDVSGPVELDVAAASGNITVRQGPAGRMRVSGELSIRDSGGSWAFWRRGARLSSDEAEALVQRFESAPPVELSGGRLMVGHIDNDWGRGFSVRYDIEVPAATDIRSRTGSGRLHIEGVGGSILAQTGSGRVDLLDIHGAVEARSGSGAISGRNIAGNFEGHAGSGSIVVDLVTSGEVSVSTGSGSIRLVGVDGGLDARAGSGSIAVDGQPNGDWNLTTGSGSITLRLPAEAAFDLEARTGSGGVSTDHPLTIQGSIDRNRLSGQVRGGGSLITARTGSGGIRID